MSTLFSSPPRARLLFEQHVCHRCAAGRGVIGRSSGSSSSGGTTSSRSRSRGRPRQAGQRHPQVRLPLLAVAAPPNACPALIRRTSADPPCFTPNDYEYQTLNMVSGEWGWRRPVPCTAWDDGAVLPAVQGLHQVAGWCTTSAHCCIHNLCSHPQGLDTYINILMARGEGLARAALTQRRGCCIAPALARLPQPAPDMHCQTTDLGAGEGPCPGRRGHVTHHCGTPNHALHCGGVWEGCA